MEIEKKKVRLGSPSVEVIQPYLKEARKNANITIKKIESIFGNSAAHHWFEKIEYASLPDIDQWIKLKEILQFDDTHDKIMTEFRWMSDYEIMLEHKARHQGKGNGFGIIEKTPEEKAITLTTWAERTQIIKTDNFVRRLTPIECERLQGVPDGFTNHIPESKRYEILGNGWSVDTIAYIFRHIR